MAEQNGLRIYTVWVSNKYFSNYLCIKVNCSKRQLIFVLDDRWYINIYKYINI